MLKLFLWWRQSCSKWLEKEHKGEGSPYLRQNDLDSWHCKPHWEADHQAWMQKKRMKTYFFSLLILINQWHSSQPPFLSTESRNLLLSTYCKHKFYVQFGIFWDINQLLCCFGFFFFSFMLHLLLKWRDKKSALASTKATANITAFFTKRKTLAFAAAVLETVSTRKSGRHQPLLWLLRSKKSSLCFLRTTLKQKPNESFVFLFWTLFSHSQKFLQKDDARTIPFYTCIHYNLCFYLKPTLWFLSSWNEDVPLF